MERQGIKTPSNALFTINSSKQNQIFEKIQLLTIKRDDQEELAASPGCEFRSNFRKPRIYRDQFSQKIYRNQFSQEIYPDQFPQEILSNQVSQVTMQLLLLRILLH